MVFMITFNNNVYAAELDNMQHNDQAYVLNSFSGNNLESIAVRILKSQKIKLNLNSLEEIFYFLYTN